jgi:hypothetical protein
LSTGANGGSPIVSYQVWWKTETDETYALAGSTSASTLQMTKEVSSPGTVYNFKVSATNDAGTSLFSEVLSVKAADQPSTIATPIKIFADITQIQIGWSAPTDTGYSTVLGYKVYWNGGGSGSIIATEIYDTESASILTYTLEAPDLVAGVTYSFAVAAYNDVTTSDQSNIIQIIAAETPD